MFDFDSTKLSNTEVKRIESKLFSKIVIEEKKVVECIFLDEIAKYITQEIKRAKNIAQKILPVKKIFIDISIGNSVTYDEFVGKIQEDILEETLKALLHLAKNSCSIAVYMTGSLYSDKDIIGSIIFSGFVNIQDLF